MQKINSKFLIYPIALILSFADATFAQQKLNIQDGQDGGNSRGIFMWSSSTPDWGLYMSSAGAGKSLANGTAISGAGFSSHAIRFRSNSTVSNGFIFENKDEKLLFSLRGNDGLGYFTGNVGIGTLNPTSRLEVMTPTAGIGAQIASFGSATNFIPSSVGRFLFFDENVNKGIGPILNFNAGNASQITSGGVLALIPTGNLGIGTTNPGAKLEVFGGDLRIIKSTTNNGLQIGAGSDGTRFTNSSTSNTSDFIFEVGDGTANSNFTTKNEIFRILKNGQIKITGGSPGAGKVLVSDANGLASWQANPAGTTNFRDGAYIGGDKTVASMPQILRSKYNLFVEKGVLAEDYAIAPVSNWADYVFDNNYSLRPLLEVEKFIKKNKHLPEIPSQKEVSENGYSTHDINKKLLQKIEELTLYTIGLQKQLLEQKTNLNTLKKKLRK